MNRDIDVLAIGIICAAAILVFLLASFALIDRVSPLAGAALFFSPVIWAVYHLWRRRRPKGEPR